MKKARNANEATLAKIESLTSDLRQIDLLDERRLGVFYLDRKEVVHFHELPDAIVADLFLPSGRKRLPVTTRSEQLEVLDHIWDSVENVERRNSRKGRKI